MDAKQEQEAAWNGAAGAAWVEAQAVLDAVLEPFVPLLVEGVAPGTRVLDVGCGAGATTVALAEAGAHATGVDISAPMIAAARARGSAAEFVCADAETHAFTGFDLVVSRFGVMFFADPVRAFANLRAAAPALRAIVWRGLEDNPFMTTAERAAAPLLPDLPARDLDGPGQFALADPDAVRRILGDAGWEGVEVEPLDVPCVLPTAELPGYVQRLGPVGRALDGVDAATREAVVETVLAAFAPFVHGDEVRFTSACWRVTA